MPYFKLDSVEKQKSYVTLLELKNSATAASVQREGNVTILYSNNYSDMRKKIGQSYSNFSVADLLTYNTFNLLSLNNAAIAVLSPSAFDSNLLGRTTLTLGEPGPAATIDLVIPEICSVTYIVITAVDTGYSYVFPGEDLKSINARLITSNSNNGYKTLKFTPSDYDEKSGFEGKKKCVSFVLKYKTPTF